MELVVNAGYGVYYFHQLESPTDELKVPFNGEPYVCLVWDSRGDTTKEERFRLASTLIATGCRYVVCGGKSCDEWHDSADDAFLALNLNEQESEEKWVATDGLTNCSIDYVIWWFVYCTDSEDENSEISKYLAVQIGSDEAKKRRLIMDLKKHAGT